MRQMNLLIIMKPAGPINITNLKMPCLHWRRIEISIKSKGRVIWIRGKKMNEEIRFVVMNTMSKELSAEAT